MNTDQLDRLHDTAEDVRKQGLPFNTLLYHIYFNQMKIVTLIDVHRLSMENKINKNNHTC